MWIMISGPYRSGAGTHEERARNLRKMNRIAYEILRRGHVPIIGVNMALPVIGVAGEEVYEDIMMPLSLALAERCDGALRIGGESRGADQEVEKIRARGGVVFETIEQVPDERNRAGD